MVSQFEAPRHRQFWLAFAGVSKQTGRVSLHAPRRFKTPLGSRINHAVENRAFVQIDGEVQSVHRGRTGHIKTSAGRIQTARNGELAAVR